MKCGGMIFLSLFCFALPAMAEVTVEPPKQKVFAKPTELLKCKPAAKKEEIAVREAAEAQNFSDHEVFSRLVLAESLSTGYFTGRCEAPSADALMEAIGWGVINRVKKYSPQRDDPKADAYFHVVFSPKQFTTSFSSKNDNPFAKVFLCPESAGRAYLEKAGSKEDPILLYNRAKEIGAKVMDHYQRSGVPVTNVRLTQFFYPYSEFSAGRPAWAKDSDPVKNKGYVNVLGGQKPCAEFYRR